MISLIGHGYIGRAIAAELDAQHVPFRWHHHADRWFPDGDAIINAAGYTGHPNVDACETERQACMLGNVAWPLLCEARAQGLPVVHIGSGCIYEGGEFDERDAPNFTGSFYALCKATAEQALKPLLRRSYILRIRIPFGGRAHAKNYLTKLATYPRLVDVRNSISCVEDVARVAVHFARTEPRPGIYNVVNPGAVTARQVVAMMGLRKAWFATYDEFRASVRAPRSNCILNSDKLQQIYPLRHVCEALSDSIEAMKHEQQIVEAAD